MLKKFTLAAITAATMFVGASAMTGSAEARPWHHRWHRAHMMHRGGCGGMWMFRHHHRMWMRRCY
jgi:ketosteroid isomerase-like protein